MKSLPGAVREVLSPNDPAFTPMMRLYEEALPPDEREPVEVLAEGLGGNAHEKPTVDHMLIYEEESHALGFMYFSYLRECGIGFFVYLAVEPIKGRRGIGTYLYRAAIDRCRKDAANEGRQLHGFILEVERAEDAPHGSQARHLRVKRIRWFNRLGAIRITATYIQPALKSGKNPIPLNLLWHTVDAGIDLEGAIQCFYKTIFDLEPHDELVGRAVRGLEDLPYACSTFPYP